MMEKGMIGSDGHLVSVIVPIYNVEPYLVKCLESICEQSYRTLDIILIDDGGKDGCPAICDRYAQKDDRIRVIHKENGGLSDARNAGIDIHRGEYIFFVDADDFIHPDTIKDLLDIAIKEEADIVECGVQYAKEGKEIERWLGKRTGKTSVYDHDQAIERFLDYQSMIIGCSKLYKAKLFESIRFPIGKLHEDEFLTPYLVDMCSKYVLLNDKYYTYLQRKNSIMNSDFDPKRLDILEAHKERLDFFSEKYGGRYDDIMRYHFFVSCVKLKRAMKDKFKNCEVEKIYRELYKDIMSSKTINIEKRLKTYIYRYFAWLILKKSSG